MITDANLPFLAFVLFTASVVVPSVIVGLLITYVFHLLHKHHKVYIGLQGRVFIMTGVASLTSVWLTIYAVKLNSTLLQTVMKAFG